MDGATHWIRPMRTWCANCLLLLVHVVRTSVICRFGEIAEVAGFVGYPLQASNCESLAHVLLKFSGGATGVLHGHFMDIPMHKLPFFQIFGDKVNFSLK